MLHLLGETFYQDVVDLNLFFQPLSSITNLSLLIGHQPQRIIRELAILNKLIIKYYPSHKNPMVWV